MFLPKRYVEISIKDYRSKELYNIKNENSLGARVDFSIERYPNSYDSGLNTAQIKIYNLNDDTFESISKSAKYIKVIAGYNHKNNVIFTGTVQTTLRRKEMTEIVTTLYCSTNAGLSSKTVISEAIKSKKLRTFLVEIADKLEFDADLDSDLTNVIQNKSFYGSVFNVLNKLAKDYKFEWWLDNDILKVRKTQDKIVPKVSFSFTPESGLLKPPMKTEAGADIEVFLEPYINPSDYYTINAKFLDYNISALEFRQALKDRRFDNIRVPNKDRYVGKYRVLNLIHEGSTHTNTWYTRIVGLDA